MKPLILLVTLITLSACYSGPTREQIVAQDDAYCQNIGFKPGTDGYGNCRLKRTQLRIQINESEAIRTCHNYGGFATTCF